MSFSRITLGVVTLFWVTMTYFLWRSEYIGWAQGGTAVPVETVWKKILNSPDASDLDILHDGKRMGSCRWSSSVSEDVNANEMLSDDASSAAGMVHAVTNFKLKLENGSVLVDELKTRLTFSAELSLSTNSTWQEFHLRFGLKTSGMSWDIHTRAADKTIEIVTQEGRDRTDKVIKFSDLDDPQALLKDFDVPAPLAFFGGLNPMATPGSTNTLSVGLHWQARNDWMKIGHTEVRAYRLEATVLERYRMLIVISQVGEIVKVELPDKWELINNNFSSL